MDYGNLIWVTLQRARTAREAIYMFGNLTATYGYASEGESFSIADPNEVWVLELIGKGPSEKGAVWVAVRIPDGYVSGHANQARIRTFPRNDDNAAIYSHDVVTFARRKGLYNGTDAEFSFSDVYDPVGFGGARFCEVRVWDFFNRVTAGMGQYLDYVQGRNLTNRMPLYVRPTKQLSLNDTMWYHRTHFEGTWFDNRGLPGSRPDVGAGAFNSPYRWRPLEWKAGPSSASYVNERTVGVHQTGWSFVAQMRGHLPNAIGGLFWFGVDDTAHSVHTPIYCSATAVPSSFADRFGQVPPAAVPTAAVGDAINFSFDSAWWVFNLVANFVYPRYADINPEVQREIATKEGAFFTATSELDQRAAAVYASNPKAAVEMLTAFSVETGDELTKQWLALFTRLFAKYRDGFISTPTLPVCKKGETKGCLGRPVPDCKETGYPQPWYNRVAKECGEHCKVPDSIIDTAKNDVVDKLRLI